MGRPPRDFDVKYYLTRDLEENRRLTTAQSKAVMEIARTSQEIARQEMARQELQEKEISRLNERVRMQHARIDALTRVLRYVLAGIDLDDNLEKYANDARVELAELERSGYGTPADPGWEEPERAGAWSSEHWSDSSAAGGVRSPADCGSDDGADRGSDVHSSSDHGDRCSDSEVQGEPGPGPEI